MKKFLRGLLIRIGLLLAGTVLLAASLWFNINAGREILSGLFSPESPTTIVVSVARLLAPAIGIFLVYRSLR